MVTPGWLSNRMTMPVTVVNRVPNGHDEYNNVVYDSTVVLETRGFLGPSSQEEIQGGRAGVGSFTLFLPAEARPHIDTFTAFVIGGLAYEAIGPPAAFTAFTNSPGPHHVEVLVQAVPA